jgi:hypothetical protein
LVDYRAEWPALYEREVVRIHAALGERVLLLEHIGSTAVPGHAAKPVIDVCLAVADPAVEAEYVSALEQAGYVLRIREPEWFQHRLFNGPDTPVNVHVFGLGARRRSRAWCGFGTGSGPTLRTAGFMRRPRPSSLLECGRLCSITPTRKAMWCSAFWPARCATTSEVAVPGVGGWIARW